MGKISVIKEASARKTDPGKLISAVKKHPAVWNTRCPEYKFKKTKELAWDKIAREMVDGWQNYSRNDKQITLRFLIKRWNNIRDYYVKSLKARRRKKYAFADQLSFLHPELERKMQFQLYMNQSKEEDFKIETLDEEELDEDMDHNPVEEEVLEEALEELDEEEEIQEDYVTIADSFDHNYDDSDHSRRKETLQYDDIQEREEDSDLMFLKSLLPDMKKLLDDEKFTFKYAIMQAYMDILHKRKARFSV